MKKTILILLFINSFLEANYSMASYSHFSEITRNYCISDFYIENDNGVNKLWSYECSDSQFRWSDLSKYNITITDNDNDNKLIYENNVLITDEISNSNDSTDTPDNNDSDKTKLSDYTIDNTLPLNSENLTALGLSDEDLNFNFAFSGILMSLLFLFGIFKFI